MKHKEKPIPPLMSEAGSSGLVWNQPGYVNDEFHQDLRGNKASKVYREMGDNHPLVGAAFMLIEMFARHVPTWVEAAGETPEHERAKLLIETALEDVDGGIDKIFSESMSMLQFGWAYLEKVFKLSKGDNAAPQLNSKFDDGLWRWRKLRICGQESLDYWDLDENSGEVIGLFQRAAPNYQQKYIPRSKALHIRLMAKKDNPEGWPILRPAYVSYYYQKNLQVTEAVGIYRNVAGFPKITVPVSVANASAGSAEALVRAGYEEMGKKVCADEYTFILMPPKLDREGNPTGYDFELIASSGRNLAETDPIIRRYRSEVGMALMVQFLLLGTGPTGSWALSSDQTDVFALVAGAVIDTILDELNEDAVRELCILNGIDAKFAPTIKRGDIEKPELAATAAYVSQLITAGAITPDDRLEDSLRELGNLPERDQISERAGGIAVPGTVIQSVGPPAPGATDPGAGAINPGLSGIEEKSEEPPPNYVPVRQLAERWAISPSSVHKLIKTGELKAVRFGGSIRVAMPDADEFEKMLRGMGDDEGGRE